MLLQLMVALPNKVGRWVRVNGKEFVALATASKPPRPGMQVLGPAYPWARTVRTSDAGGAQTPKRFCDA